MFQVADPVDVDARKALSEYDDLIASLLVRRGITNAQAAEAFLSPSYDEHLGDPRTLLGMEKAVARIKQALVQSEHIAVWSDYDCDGIPGGVILHDFFTKAGAMFTNYVPHRHDEGFGLNERGIEKLKAEGTSLIITVDCGIADIRAVALAQSLGIDVIVTDHHLPTLEAGKQHLPPAYAIIDPKQDGETYPFREFCGAGLAWKLVCALLHDNEPFPASEAFHNGWEKWLLDMAGLATIADMVPLTGENRVIARYGLLVMRKSPRIGFQKLCKAARVNQSQLTEDDVAFMLAPRVNAASRMGDAMDAFRLFTTTDEDEADLLAKKLEALNRSRRAAAAAVTKSVRERLAERSLNAALPEVIVAGDPDWRPGLLGTVANNVADEFERPVFLWGREGNNVLKGSCRAGRPDVHLLELMQAAPDTFIEFGGHRASGGFSVREEAIHSLEARLIDAYASVSVTHDDMAEYADRELSLTDATSYLLSKLEQLAPFGMGNPKPTFLLKEVCIQNVAWFGKAGEHLRLRLASPNDKPASLEAISFYARRELGASCETLANGATRTIVGSLERDQFSRGRPVRVRITALR